jgi:hypothetical protein
VSADTPVQLALLDALDQNLLSRDAVLRTSHASVGS